MNDNTFIVIFSGRCLSGFDEAAVRESLSTQLKLTALQIDAMFVGRAVAIKRKQSLEQAERLMARLRDIGMDVTIKPDLAAAPPAAPAPQAVPAPTESGLALAPQQPPPRLTGEKIGCYRCGTPVEAPGFCAACAASNGAAPSTGLASEADALAPEPGYSDTRFWGISLDGRMGCLRYVCFISLLFLVGQLSGAAIMLQAFEGGFRNAASNAGIVAVLLLYLFILLLGARLSVLRLHDLNRSGLWLLGFLALFGALLAAGETGRTLARTLGFWALVLLMVMPGSAEANLFGDPDAPPPGWLSWLNLGSRIGRLRYASYSALAAVVVMLVAVVVIEHLLSQATFGGLTAIMTAGMSVLSMLPTLVVLTLVAALRLLTLRLRDLGLSGQWVVLFVASICLLNLFTGGVFQLFRLHDYVLGLELMLAITVYLSLMLIPGNPASNAFGEPEHDAQGPLKLLGIGCLVLIGLLALWISNLGMAAKHLMVTADLQRAGASSAADTGESVAERVARQGWVVIFRDHDCPECEDIAASFAAVRGDVLIYFCNVRQPGNAGVACRSALLEEAGNVPLPVIARSCGPLIEGYKPDAIKAAIESGTLASCPRRIGTPPGRAPLVYDVKMLGTAGLPPVTLYTRVDCPECNESRDWLKKRNVPFSECNLTLGAGCNPNAPGGNRPRQVPQVWVGDYPAFADPQSLEEAFGFAPRLLTGVTPPRPASPFVTGLKLFTLVGVAWIGLSWFRRKRQAEA
ncbi:DUF805 domain-containing protein [Niveibacterium sp. 24ML]|uniref:DUF805 domain-containing protein n=1 Tax=Niveibacterium sp. 24ML TaxID=2985512 RepID=UPI00226E4B80|nr:DUF805 domain-containing protein [Niveibacterium sp. 24ML]MCX9156305.1 DUF805 domain-containing protein [Niveibacterium sp. 24ML]